MIYEIRQVRGHYEIYDNYGNFAGSADTYEEARYDLENLYVKE